MPLLPATKGLASPFCRPVLGPCGKGPMGPRPPLASCPFMDMLLGVLNMLDAAADDLKAASLSVG